MPDNLEIPSPEHRPPPPSYRVPRRSVMDPGTRRLALIAAGIAGVVIIVIGLWSMLGGKTSGVPVVPAPATAMRVKPANPGGMQLAGSSAPILNETQPSTAKAALAPLPETPNLQALQSLPASPPPANATSPPRANATSPAPANAASSGTASTPVAPTSVAPVEAPASTTSPTPELAQTKPPAPTTIANSLPLPPPAPPPLRLAALSTARPLPPAVGTGKATEVQLAAMSSKDAAAREWQILRRALPDLFDQRQPLIMKVEIDGHTFWRLRTGGFANIADATQFCATVRAKGRGCTIASF